MNIRKPWMVLALALVMAPFISFAQENHGGDKGDWQERHEKIKALKVAFFTQRLSLTSEEAEKFWPVYNEYEDARLEMKTNEIKANKENWKNFENLTDAQIEKLVDEYVNREQREADLDKKYFAEFKKVLPIRKVGLLLKVEHDFKAEVLKQLKGCENKSGNNSGGK